MIGQGLTSIVYKGKNDKTGEPVAIKVINMKKLNNPLQSLML